MPTAFRRHSSHPRFSGHGPAAWPGRSSLPYGSTPKVPASPGRRAGQVSLAVRSNLMGCFAWHRVRSTPRVGQLGPPSLTNWRLTVSCIFLHRARFSMEAAFRRTGTASGAATSSSSGQHVPIAWPRAIASTVAEVALPGVGEQARCLHCHGSCGAGIVFQATWPPCLLLRVKPPKPRERRHTRL